jgi:hypothetical protein
MGPEGLEPSPTRLRAGYAAANTSIPYVCFVALSRDSNLLVYRRRNSPVAIGPDGVEPSSGPYKEPALTIELRAAARLRSVRPEGFEPPPCRLKVCCAAVTPRPHEWSGVCVSVAVAASQVSHVGFRVAREGVEPSFPPYQDGVLNR